MVMGAVLPAVCAAALLSSLVAAAGTSGTSNAITHITSTTPSTHTTLARARSKSTSVPKASATDDASSTMTSLSTSTKTTSTHTTASTSPSSETTSTETTSPSTSAATTPTVTTPADCSHCVNDSTCDTETNSTCLYLLCDPVTGSCHGENQYNETETADSGSSLGSMEIAIITLSLLLAASVAVNVIIVVVKIKTKYRRPKGKARFDLVRNQYSSGHNDIIELKVHNSLETSEYQPNIVQPQFQDDEYEDLAVGTQHNAYEIPVRSTKQQTERVTLSTKVPEPRADTSVRTSSKFSVESGQRESNAVQTVLSEEAPPAEPPLPVRPERRPRSKHQEPTERSAEVDDAGSEDIVIARDSLALHALRIGVEISNKRRSGAYTLPEDGADYSVSDIEEAIESEEDTDDGLYENEVVPSLENKTPLDVDDDSDPYENEDFIDTQFRRLKYKYKLSPVDGEAADDDGEELDDAFRKASLTVQYTSNDHLNDIEEEEEEVEEEEGEDAEDEESDGESRGRYTGDSNRKSDDLNYRTVNGLVVSVDAIIDGDDYEDDSDDRDLYENEMMSRHNFGGRKAGGVSTQRTLDGTEEPFPADVSGDEGRYMDQREEDGGFVIDSTQSLTGGEVNDMVEDEQGEEKDDDVVQDGHVNDVDDDIYDEAASQDPNMKPEQTDLWETFHSTENGSEHVHPRLVAPLESPPQQNELGRENTEGSPWGGPKKSIWPENESPENGFGDDEFTPDKHTHGSKLKDVPSSHHRNVRWTVGDSESSGQTVGDEDLDEWSQALDSDFQQDPRGPVTSFDSEPDECDV